MDQSSPVGVSFGVTIPRDIANSQINGVAFIGKAGVGKTTLAQEVAKLYRIPVVPLAARLKHMVHNMLGHHNISYTTDQPKETIRPLYQAFGQFMRDIKGPDYWLEALPQQYPYIIDDVRYTNEVKFLYEKGFYLIHVKGPSRLASEMLNPNHSSEQGLDADHVAQHVDMVLYNEGTIKESLDYIMDVLTFLPWRKTDIPFQEYLVSAMTRLRKEREKDGE